MKGDSRQPFGKGLDMADRAFHTAIELNSKAAYRMIK
jgi:hypothetical protein